MLTDAQLARLVQDFYGLILDQENQGRLTRGAIPNDIRERRVAQYETMAAPQAVVFGSLIACP